MRVTSLLKALVAGLVIGGFHQVAAREAEFVPPAEIVAKVSPLLRSSEEILSAPVEVPKSAEDGLTLLSEEAQYFTEDGHRYIVQHIIRKALTEAGADELSRDVTSFRKTTERVYLLGAQTIQPDGRRLPIKSDAAFVQTPQRDADDSIYDDQNELVVLFSGVKAGSITEITTIVEEAKPRVPGHLNTGFGFEYGWPMLKCRATLDLPVAWAAKLRISPLGAGVPEPVKSTTTDRARWVWQRVNCPPIPQEADYPPLGQKGPYVWLTTMSSWDDFLFWYAPKVEAGSVVGEKLRKEIDACAASAKSRREVIECLTAKVANEVRYVGLEFGRCDIEPHDINSVWENQYGDCKDKATLLQAMLNARGIHAYVALVNAEHLGLIDRRSPDFRQFDHAIVAVEEPEGGWLFCDPTVAWLPAGQLAPSDCDRDVLLVKSGATWLHTPRQSAGRIVENYDAKLAPTGALSGWLDFEASGFLGAWYRRIEMTESRDELRNVLTRIVRGAWEEARVVDVKTSSGKSEDGSYHVKAYFVVPRDDARSLKFPFPPKDLPSLEQDRQRVSDYPLWMKTREIKARIVLPEGVSPAALPAETSFSSPYSEGRASWSSAPGEVTAKVTFQTKQPRVPAAGYAEYANAASSMRLWLAKPLALQAGAGPALGKVEDPLSDFPKMPSGEGQLNLIDEKYPSTGNHDLRRRALEKTLEMFPEDAATRFNAGVQIAFLDAMDKKPDEALKRLQPLLGAQQGIVSLENASFGRYVLAMAFEGKKEPEKAVEIYASLAANENLSDYRRAWSQYRIARVLGAKKPEDAVKAARAGVALETDLVPQLMVEAARGMIKGNRVGDLEQDLTALVERRSSAISECLASLAGLVESTAAENEPQSRALLAMIERHKEDGDDSVKEALAGVKERLKSAESHRAVARKFKELAVKYADLLPAVQLPAGLDQPDAMLRWLDDVESRKKDPDLSVRGTLEYLTRFEPSEHFSNKVWRAAVVIDWWQRSKESERMQPLLDEIFDLSAQMAKDDEANIECAFLKATILTRKRKYAEVHEIFTELLARPELGESYRITALVRQGDSALANRDYDGAIAAWEETIKLPVYSTTVEYLLKLVFLHLDKGNRADAFRVLDVLRRIKPATIRKSIAALQVTELLALSSDPQKANAAWDSSARWQAAWQAVDRKLGPASAEPDLKAPFIPDLEELGRVMAEAIQENNTEGRAHGLRMLAAAARWEPGMAAELGDMLFSLQAFRLATVVQEYRALTISLYENVAASDPVARRQLCCSGAAAYIDSGRGEKALDANREFWTLPGGDDNFSQAMSRLWAVAASSTGKEMEQAAAGSEKALASSDYKSMRGMGVLLLVQLYERLRNEKAAIALLEREMENPAIKSDAANLAQLKNHWDALKNGGSLSNRLSKATREWIETEQIPWFDFVRPHAVAEFPAEEIDKVLSGSKGFTAVERAKLAALVIQDESQPEQRRLDAVSALGWELSSVSPDSRTAIHWAKSFLDHEELPDQARGAFLYSFAFGSFLMGDFPVFESVAAHPARKLINEQNEEKIRRAQSFVNATKSGEEECVRMAGDLLQREFAQESADCFRRIVDQFALHGNFEKARELIHSLGALPPNLDVEHQKATLQLSLLKLVSKSEQWIPVKRALTRVTLARFGDKASGAETADPIPPGRLSIRLNLSEEAATAARLRVIRDGKWDGEEMHFWTTLMRDLPRTKENQEFRIQLLRAALEAAPNDSMRAEVLSSVRKALDVDSPEERAVAEELVKPYRKLSGQPKTADALRLEDISVALRTGAPLDVLSAISLIKDEQKKNEARRHALVAALASGDGQLMRSLLDAIKPDELMSDFRLESSYRVYRALGMQEEASLLQQNAGEAIRRMLNVFCVTGSGDIALQAISTAEAIGDSEAVPESLMKPMIASLRHRRSKLMLDSGDAVYRKDWARALKSSSEGLREYPSYYLFFWFQAEALAGLNRSAEAVESLQSYLKVVHNEPEVAEARELLKKLSNLPVRPEDAAPTPATGQ